MDFNVEGNDIVVNINDYHLEYTLDCGQSFRWKKIVENDREVFYGIVDNHSLKIYQDGNKIVFKDTNLEVFKDVWLDYFDFNTDYDYIKQTIIQDSIIKKACEYAGGIRILKQRPWEMICSFIISQNNNIPRIKVIIERLCERYGDKLKCGGYSFPDANTLASIKLEELLEIKAGFRTKYILDAANKLSSGFIDIEYIKSADIDEARSQLMQIKGVGPKVAECVLLFGFYRLEAFPIDVWIKRALDYYYPEDGFPEYAKPYGGVAQQYIFHYIRTCKDAIPKEYRKK